MIIAGTLANIWIGLKSNIELLYELHNIFIDYITYSKLHETFNMLHSPLLFSIPCSKAFLNATKGIQGARIADVRYALGGDINQILFAVPYVQVAFYVSL